LNPREITNIAASVHRRLLNKSKDEGRPLNELLRYYAMERFLYRLSKSSHASEFVLKGALMIHAWEAPLSRPTSDIDFLGLIRNDEESVVSVVKEVCDAEVEPDGLEFDTGNIRTETITDIAESAGIRVKFMATLGSARIPVQVDTGFGDPVIPMKDDETLEVLLVRVLELGSRIR
jgi:hypothetical protein